MSKQTQPVTDKKVVVKRVPNNSFRNPVKFSGLDFSCKTRMHRHMIREGNAVKIVEDGLVDEDALIQSESCNAGLQNIIRLQTMRYGTIQNAIARNADKQVFADVSKIPTSVAEQSEYVKGIQEDVDALCAKLGISKEDLLKATQESLAQRLEALKTASGASNGASSGSEGGNE